MSLKILFVCVGNAYRSIMAEAYGRKYMKGFEIKSAGIRPFGYVPEEVIKVLEEDEVDTSGLFSKSVSIYNVSEFDYIIVLSRIFFFAPTNVIYYDVEDPAFSSMDFLRKIRNQIKQIVIELSQKLS